MNVYSPQQVLSILELDYPIARQLRECRSYDQGVEILDRFKEAVLKQRRVLAKKYHPDLGNGGEEKMKQINGVVDFVKLMRVYKPSPPPVFVYSFSFGTGGSTSSNSYTNVYY